MFELIGWTFIVLAAGEAVLSAVVIDDPPPRSRTTVVLNALAQLALAVWLYVAIGRLAG